MEKGFVIKLKENLKDIFEIESKFNYIIEKIVEEKSKHCKLDVLEKSVLSSGELTLIARIANHCNKNEVIFSLINCNKHILSSLKVTKIDRICNIESC